MALNADMAIQPQFDEATDFSEGLAAVKIGGKWGFVDKSGKFVIPLGDYKWACRSRTGCHGLDLPVTAGAKSTKTARQYGNQQRDRHGNRSSTAKACVALWREPQGSMPS